MSCLLARIKEASKEMMGGDVGDVFLLPSHPRRNP